MYYTVSFNAFKNAIGQSRVFAVLRVLKSYFTWIMCPIEFRELSLSFWWGCHILWLLANFLPHLSESNILFSIIVVN